MGVCFSQDHSELDEGVGTSNNVEIELLEEQINELFKFKILLLGAGESGKSTVVKQLKLIHKKKILEDEKRLVALSLHQNTVECMKALLNACTTFDYELGEAETKIADELACHDEALRITPEFGLRILTLWESEPVQQAYNRRSEYWFLDSFKYYITNLERFAEEDFSPTEEDCVMARIRTTGIVVTNLEQKIKQDVGDAPDTLQFQVVDVGGQRNERKKWMHCFDDVKCILFIVNLAGYDQVLFEDAGKNRMLESLELFEQVTKNAVFKETPVFVFLNKKDLFESLVQNKDMSSTFKNYDGGTNMHNALEFVQEEFKKRLPPGKDVDFQVISARWKRDIRTSFEEVKGSLYFANKATLLEKVSKIRKEQRQVEAQSSRQNKSMVCC